MTKRALQEAIENKAKRLCTIIPNPEPPVPPSSIPNTPNDSMVPKNELDIECANIIASIRQKGSQCCKTITKDNNRMLNVASIKRSKHTSKQILAEKLEMENQILKLLKLLSVNRQNLAEDFGQHVMKMENVNELQDIEHSLVKQMNCLTEECRIATSLMVHSRTEIEYKTKMWKHLQQQLKVTRKLIARE